MIRHNLLLWIIRIAKAILRLNNTSITIATTVSLMPMDGVQIGPCVAMLRARLLGEPLSKDDLGLDDDAAALGFAAIIHLLLGFTSDRAEAENDDTDWDDLGVGLFAHATDELIEAIDTEPDTDAAEARAQFAVDLLEDMTVFADEGHLELARVSATNACEVAVKLVRTVEEHTPISEQELLGMLEGFLLQKAA